MLPLLVGCALLAALIGLHRGGPTWAADATTSAGQDLQVIDGDTLQSGGDIVQLYGIDAPELGQLCWRRNEPWQCGVEAAFALQKLVQLSGLAVTCVSWHDASETEGPNGEVIRACQLGDEEDLGMALLRNGHGWARPGSFPVLRPARAPRQGDRARRLGQRGGPAVGVARRPARRRQVRQARGGVQRQGHAGRGRPADLPGADRPRLRRPLGRPGQGRAAVLQRRGGPPRRLAAPWRDRRDRRQHRALTQAAAIAGPMRWRWRRAPFRVP